MEGSDQTGVYIMIFFQTRRSTLHENGVREAHDVATSPPGTARGWARAGQACRLLADFPDYFQFLYFSNIPKRRKIPIGKVWDSIFLPNLIFFRFRSLKQADKCPLGILPELWY